MTSPTRDVHLHPGRVYSFGEYQFNYMDYRTLRLIPSTRIFQEGVLYYRTNALGCVGEDIDEGMPVVAFFGDSCTHGHAGNSYCSQVRINGCAPVNAGIEGIILPWIVDRFHELKDRVPLVAAAVHTGWHNILYNERSEDYWASHLDRISGPPVIAHFRLVADINEDAVREGYNRLLATHPKYYIWGGFDHTDPADRRRMVGEMNRFNRFIEAYCHDRGRILIDMDPAMRPKTYDDLGTAFLDFIHPSEAAYPAMARTVEAALAGPVARALAIWKR